MNYISAEICQERCKATEARIKMAEELQEVKDEEQERTIGGLSKKIGQLFGFLKRDSIEMKEQIKETNKRIDSLEKKIPDIIETSIKNIFVEGAGKTVIFILKTILISGVLGGVVAAVIVIIKGCILGG